MLGPANEGNGEGGFPHSEIAGSKFAHNSPTLIAACHVLLRLYMPRHSPDALTLRLRIRTTNGNAVSHADRFISANNINDIDLSRLRVTHRYHGIDLKTHSQCQGGGQIPPYRIRPRPNRNLMFSSLEHAACPAPTKCRAWWSLSGSNR